ncbi:MAG: GNAT family N-acetyltransferase [Proteobacteria bacterium]|nr:GNAT family N-acetyltransferase [Pseudomonadota bacterium]
MNAQPEEEIPDLNLFMMCKQLNSNALSELSDVVHIRNCRKNELDIWKDMPFDDPKEAKENREFMTDYFATVYTNKGDLFFEKCLFVCDTNDNPIATAFIWKAYDEFNTVHWFKVLRKHEGKGIGRALLSTVMKKLEKEDYPVYLHTQPASYRALKLYSDFGFNLLSDAIIGRRSNDLEECLPILEKYMTNKDFKRLQTSAAPGHFLKNLEAVKDDQF